MYRLGIIGCGMTGAVTAMLIKQRMPNINIVILEKSKGTGGRMCTSRSSLGSFVDLGAQFITKTSHLTDTQEKCYNQLLEAGLLKPLQENIEGLRKTSSSHFICPQGSGSLVKHFLQAAECNILFGHKVEELRITNNKWMTHCDNGSNHEFDAVVLTVPVPQILQLKGIASQLEGSLEKLKAVNYCSRFALGYFYDKDHEFFKNCPWSAKFLSDDIIRYCSLDHRKRSANGLPSLVIHTTKEFGKAHIDESNVTMVQDTIVQRLQQLFPDIPAPSQVKFHKWRYSQVEKNSNGGCLKLSETPLLICGGDGFSISTFEGCVLSAEKIVQNIINIES